MHGELKYKKVLTDYEEVTEIIKFLKDNGGSMGKIHFYETLRKRIKKPVQCGGLI